MKAKTLHKVDPHCHWCECLTAIPKYFLGRVPKDWDATVDHIKCRGEVESLAEWSAPANKVLSCYRCNQKRNSKFLKSNSGKAINFRSQRFASAQGRKEPKAITAEHRPKSRPASRDRRHLRPRGCREDRESGPDYSRVAHPDAIKLSMTLEDKILSELAKKIEIRLITVVEEIEGRVPTNDEIRVYGHCGTYPSGKQEWRWKGQTIIVVHPPTNARWSYLIVG